VTEERDQGKSHSAELAMGDLKERIKVTCKLAEQMRGGGEWGMPLGGTNGVTEAKVRSCRVSRRFNWPGYWRLERTA